MTIIARRFAIICLTSALFAIGLWTIVDNSKRSTHIGQFDLSAPCPQPHGLQCTTRL